MKSRKMHLILFPELKDFTAMLASDMTYNIDKNTKK